MSRIDVLYSSNQPSSGVSPYVTTGSSTSFRGPKSAAAQADAAAAAGAGRGQGADGRHEYQLRAYLQKITNEALATSIE